MSVLILKPISEISLKVVPIEEKSIEKTTKLTRKRSVSFHENTKSFNGLSKDNKYFNQLMYEILGHTKYHKNLLGRMIYNSKSEYMKLMHGMLIDLIKRCQKDNEPGQKGYRYLGRDGKIKTPILPGGGGYNLMIILKCIPNLEKKAEYIQDQINSIEDYDFMYSLGQ